MNPPRILFVGMKPEALARIVPAFKGVEVQTMATAQAAAPFATQADGTVCVVSLAPDVEGGLGLVASLVAGSGDVIALGPTKDADLILKVMRAGVREFVVDGDDEALKRAIRARLRIEETRAPGKVVTVFPAKGGMGATAIAANLAGALARGGNRVCLVDLDLDLGDALAFLDLPATYTLADVVANMRRLDRELLDTSLVRHKSGFSVLAGGDRPEESDRVDAKAVAGLLSFLRQHFAYVVVDGVRGFNEFALTALDASEVVLLVATQEVAAVRDAQRCVEIFARLGYDESKVKLVVNRFQKQSKITSRIISDAVGRPVNATLANDFFALLRSVNRGVLLSDEAPRSHLTRDIESLIPLVAGEKTVKPRRGFFRRVFPARTVAHGA